MTMLAAHGENLGQAVVLSLAAWGAAIVVIIGLTKGRKK